MPRLFIGNSAADGAVPLTGVLACDTENCYLLAKSVFKKMSVCYSWKVATFHIFLGVKLAKCKLNQFAKAWLPSKMQ